MQSSTQSLARALALAALLCGGAAAAQPMGAPDAGTPGESENPHDVANKDKMVPAETAASPAKRNQAGAIDPNSTLNKDAAHPTDPRHPTAGEYNEAEALNPHSAASQRRQATPDLLERLHVSNQGEIAAGKLAQAQGGARTVEFGRTLVSDHTDADQQLTTVAQQLGVTLSDMPKSSRARSDRDDAKKMRDHLGSLKGPDFDRAFARDMESDHEKDISMVQIALGTCSEAALCALLKQELPVLQKHRQLARDLQKPAAQGRRGE